MGVWKSWTEQEDQIIREVYPEHGARATMDELKKRHFIRTMGALKERARALGVKRDMSKVTRTTNRVDTWTADEIETLKRIYPEKGAEAVREALLSMGINRTKQAITVRAHMCGVKKKFRYGRPTGAEKVVRNICLDTVLDADIIKRLDTVRNRSEYVRTLVAKDIREKK